MQAGIADCVQVYFGGRLGGPKTTRANLQRQAPERRNLSTHVLMIGNWICCQIGAREHYAIPRALHQRGQLCMLLTDAWVTTKNPLAYIKRSVGDRYHPQLVGALVKSAMTGLLLFEGIAKIRGVKGWHRILARNEWFQRVAVAAMANQLDVPSETQPNRPVVFAYSYAARDIFRWAKARGWQTVLGQIDAGAEMGRILARLDEKHPEYRSRSDPPPSCYWDVWRDECALADRIIVNSEWSRKALILERVASDKIQVVPLAFEEPREAMEFQRNYPSAFTATRPLRVLFLGQVNLLKGIASLLEASEILRDEPIEFRIVGEIQVNIPEPFRSHPRILWEGLVSRSATAAYYQEADVFLFPTHCDGFGLTQLEAQAWQLPVIASLGCGDVVVEGLNGIRLPKVTGESIAKALRILLKSPATLQDMARNSRVNPTFSLANIGRLLCDNTIGLRSSA